CSADPKCSAAVGADGVLNPFSAFGGITQDELAYLMANSLKDNYQTKMTMATFVVDGEFGKLPGGAIGWAVGLDTRSESARIRPDEFSAGGLTTGGALDPLQGSYNVNEVYGEVRLPLIADAPFVQSFDITASTRYSDYNTGAGSQDTYKVGFDWAINDQIRARAVYSTGFRAPNMVEYFTQAVTFPQSENYCEFTSLRNDISAVAKTNCTALGYDGLYEQGGEWQSTYSQTAAGGDDLGPEDSETWTAGVVLTPHFVEGLELSFDWFNIQIDDYIGLPDYNFLVKTCLESINFSAPACAAFPSGTGILDANNGVADNAATSLGNLGSVESAGADVAARYTHDVEWGPISMVNAGIEAAYLDKAEKSFPLTGSYSLEGTAGEGGVAVYPEWRYNATFGVGGESWNVTWTVRYIDESVDLYRPASITDDATAEEVYYNDIAATYTYDAYSVIVGVDNVADEEPPLFHSGFNMDTAPGYYDSLGRRMFMSVKMSL
ncbi:MAG TPA: TonB-dependent receptor, partial [Pseudomonadales bacterium]